MRLLPIARFAKCTEKYVSASCRCAAPVVVPICSRCCPPEPVVPTLPKTKDGNEVVVLWVCSGEDIAGDSNGEAIVEPSVGDAAPKLSFGDMPAVV